MNGRSDRKTRRRKKQAGKSGRSAKRLGWRRQETVRLVIEGTNPQELHEAVDVAIKELSRPIRLRVPSPAEARAGKRIVTARGTEPGITLELSPGLVLGDRTGRYGFGLQRQYVIHRQGKPPIIAQMLKPLGRPRGTGRPKRRIETPRNLIKTVDLRRGAWVEVYNLLQQFGLTKTQMEVWVRWILDRPKLKVIADERKTSPQAVSAALIPARYKLLQGSKSNPKLADRLMLCLAPSAEQTEQPGPTRYQPSRGSRKGWTRDESSGASYRRDPDQQDLEQAPDYDKD